MAIKLVFDTVEDFKQIFNFFNMIEEDGTGMISEVSIPEAEHTVCLDDFNTVEEMVEEPMVEAEHEAEHLIETVNGYYFLDNIEDPHTIKNTAGNHKLFGKILWYGTHKYRNNAYRTDSAHSGGLHIMIAESLFIIPFMQEGKWSDKAIFNALKNEVGISWEGDGQHSKTCESTIRSFRKHYNSMNLNMAITYICLLDTVDENPFLYVKFPDNWREWITI